MITPQQKTSLFDHPKTASSQSPRMLIRTLQLFSQEQLTQRFEQQHFQQPSHVKHYDNAANTSKTIRPIQKIITNIQGNRGEISSQELR